jgi:hypothetical protein
VTGVKKFTGFNMAYSLPRPRSVVEAVFPGGGTCHFVELGAIPARHDPRYPRPGFDYEDIAGAQLSVTEHDLTVENEQPPPVPVGMLGDRFARGKQRIEQHAALRVVGFAKVPAAACTKVPGDKALLLAQG